MLGFQGDQLSQKVMPDLIRHPQTKAGKPMDPRVALCLPEDDKKGDIKLPCEIAVFDFTDRARGCSSPGLYRSLVTL